MSTTLSRPAPPPLHLPHPGASRASAGARAGAGGGTMPRIASVSTVPNPPVPRSLWSDKPNAVAGPSKPTNLIKAVAPDTPRTARTRAVLAHVKPNTPGRAMTGIGGDGRSRSPSQVSASGLPLLRIRAGANPSVTSIPRPASSPDVFAPEPILPRKQTQTQTQAQAQLGRRGGENVAPAHVLGKRTRDEYVPAPALGPAPAPPPKAAPVPAPPTVTATRTVTSHSTRPRPSLPKRPSHPPPAHASTLDVFMAGVSARKEASFTIPRGDEDRDASRKRRRESVEHDPPRHVADAPKPSREAARVAGAPRAAVPAIARVEASVPAPAPAHAPAPDAKRPRVEQQTELLKAHKAEEEKWRTKWSRVFPTLKFHFEGGGEDAQSRQLRARVIKMKASVEQFFSHQVTHLIVKSVESPKKGRPLAPSKLFNQPPVDKGGMADLASKAEDMGIKVWTAKKLADILARIDPVENPDATITRDSLSTLLEDERVNGTRERDPDAPRKDMLYFKPRSKYLLVEDATGRHRPIMAKEYAAPTGGKGDNKEQNEWPKLYDNFLRVTSANQTDVAPKKLRERAWALYVERKPFEGERPPSELRRATSMRNIPGTPKLPEARPYANASGNSVVITSNIASTSCANPSPFGARSGIPGLGLGASKDKAMAQMSKRVQVLKGNARLASFRRPQVQPNDIFAVPQRRASTGMPPPMKEFMTQEQVISMLRQARAPRDDEEVAWEIRRANRQKVDQNAQTKEQDGSSGYCENCRVRFNDLAHHLNTTKHRRFAEEDANFQDLDDLLEDLRRPHNPMLREVEYQPCHEKHTQHVYCELCDNALVYDELEDWWANDGWHPNMDELEGETEEYSEDE